MEAFIASIECRGDINAPAPSPAQYHETQENSRSYWIKNFPIELDAKWENAVVPEETDIVIIGSGITGATVAYQLSRTQPELRVVMFEARGICSGATGRNGGHMCRPEVNYLRELSKTLGTEEALRVRKLCLRNRDMMLEVINSRNAVDKVDLRLNGTYVVFDTDDERQSFEDDYNFAKELGYDPEGYMISSEEVHKQLGVTTSNHGAAYLKKSGTIYPRKLVNLLLEASLEKMHSLSLHPYTPVQSVAAEESGLYKYKVVTNKGTVRSRVVFHATNGYASHLVPSLCGMNGVFGCRSHMMGMQPDVGPDAPQLEVGFGYAQFMHWILQRPNQGPFLYGLAKAESLLDFDDTVTHPDDHPVRKEMADFLKATFPQWFSKTEDIGSRITYDWTGVQGFTKDGSSMVGRPIPGSAGEFASIGHNGEGMVRCFACATVATDAMVAHLKGDESFSVPDWFPRSYWRELSPKAGV